MRDDQFQSQLSDSSTWIRQILSPMLVIANWPAETNKRYQVQSEAEYPVWSRMLNVLAPGDRGQCDSGNKARMTQTTSFLRH